MSSLISSTRRKVVVGLGVTGLSVARHLARRGEEFTVVDTRDHPPGLEELRDEMPDVPVMLGDGAQDVLDTAAELIVSPGISPEEPWLQRAVSAGAHLCGDIDLFVAAAKAPVIGITGSNAKSTVTEMLGAMVEAAGHQVGIGGNLGIPALDLLNDENEFYVLELSSFQLERAGALNLEVATVLNVTPDHLDRHGSMPRYHQAKHRIFNGCRKVVFNSDDPLTIPPLAAGRQHIGWRLGEPDLQGFGLRMIDGEETIVEGFEPLMKAAEVALPGRHNLANALAALALGAAIDLPRLAMLTVLKRFAGLEHRCELVTEKDGVRWINDSKATNVGAALAAIKGLGASHRLILIAGGRDKDADFRALKPAVAAFCDKVLLIGEASQAIATALGDASEIIALDNLESAVAVASESAKPGDLVLLSPACASFDQFDSYVHRGEQFKKCVRAEVSL
ncbi:UDP-N-acetylmuramoyl-L-alanine--D-glutamate ligase [Congregibacter sp.]|uniref:UDP-N-acetylmuramoyl-L-alanine--D-glutamate ligase n=1 Tax=Congregibacter sp. TaxID=2744308 RepID=UPI003F6D05BE